MACRDERTVQHTEIIDIEHAAVIGDRHLLERAVRPDTGIVDPCVERAERFDRHRGDTLDRGHVADVGDADRDASALGGQAIAQSLERRRVTRGRDDGCTATHGSLDDGEAVAAGRAGNDKDLIAKGFQCDGHGDQHPSGDWA